MRTIATILFALALVPATGGGQTPASQVPDRGRPTTPKDEMPLLDFERYFSGVWTFEWDVPAGVVGPDDTVTGRTTYRHIEGDFYEGVTEAKGSQGTFTIRELLAYRKDAKTLTRHVTDSRGFSYIQTGTVGGDLGGYYSFNLTSAPFTHRGKTVRIKNTLYLVSPVQYKHTMTISIDGGPFTNYGNAWWQKDLKASTGGR